MAISGRGRPKELLVRKNNSKNYFKKHLSYSDILRYNKCQEVLGIIQISVLKWTVCRQVLLKHEFVSLNTSFDRKLNK